MALEDFHWYLEAYMDNYYTKYLLDLNLIGDCFCCMKQDRELQQWLASVGYCRPRPQKTAAPVPDISGRHQDEGEPLPAYAAALREFFHKDYQYPEEKYTPSERKRVTELELRLAAVCHAGRSTIASWKSGARVPDKYKWWALGIGEFCLSYWHIQPYLDMIGCGVDMTCLDDIILFYALCTAKSTCATFTLLHEYRCDETKKLFSPSVLGAGLERE